jgi:hypothetical protein
MNFWQLLLALEKKALWNRPVLAPRRAPPRTRRADLLHNEPASVKPRSRRRRRR